MSNYTDVQVEIDSTLSMSFPVDKLTDQFIANLYDITVNFNTQSQEEIEKILYSDHNINDKTKPGVASFIDTFIRVFIKIIGSFAKTIVTLTELVKRLKSALTNPTSKDNISFLKSLAAKVKAIMEELKKFFCDTANWLKEKILSPLSNINIPIPSFDFNIFGFSLSLPQIDNLGLFNTTSDGLGNVYQSRYTIPDNETKNLNDINKKLNDLYKKQADSKKNSSANFDKLSDLQTQSSSAKTNLDNSKTNLDNNQSKINILTTKSGTTSGLTLDEQQQLNDLNTEHSTLQKLYDNCLLVYNTIQSGITNVSNDIDTSLNNLASTIDDQITKAKSELAELLKTNPVSAYTDKLKSAFITCITFPAKFIYSLFQQVIKALTGLISFNFTEFEKFINMMKPTISSITDFLITFIDETLVNGFEKLYKAAKSKFGDIKSNISDVLTYLKNEGLKILGWDDNDTNQSKLSSIISYFALFVRIIIAFPILFIALIIELFNYALNPIDIKLPE